MFRVKMIRCEDSFSFPRYSPNVSTTVETRFDAGLAVSSGMCSEPAGLDDLSLLTHQAAQGMRSVLDRLCREQGLKDARDWFVLHALSDGISRTQLEIARLVCIDKTTLTALLDRLEDDELIVRVTDKHDRRARIPHTTDAGRKVFDAIDKNHAAVQKALLEDVSPEQAEQLFALLTRCAAAGERSGCPDN
jgi:DNA-binding MarR family transcriptional regulator